MTTVYAARGHGRKPDGTHDPGATGTDATGKLWTEQMAADLAVPAMVARLRAAGVVTIDEGVDDPNYVGTITAANAAGVDLVVSIHCDWTGGLDAHVLHWPGSTVGEALAGAIVDVWNAAAVKVAGKPVRARDDLSLLRRTAMPAVIVELGRIGSAAIDTPAELEQMGRLVANGILDHLGVARPDVAEKASPWRWPQHVAELVARSIYTADTKPGTPVGTDLLSAFLDRLRRYLERYVDDRVATLTRRVATLETSPVQVVDVEALAARVAALLDVTVEEADG